MTDEKWGCPDWQNKAAYPASGMALKSWQWKWEFLRRSPEYRTRWEQRGSTRDGESHNAFIQKFQLRGILFSPSTCSAQEAFPISIDDGPFLYSCGALAFLPDWRESWDSTRNMFKRLKGKKIRGYKNSVDYFLASIERSLHAPKKNENDEYVSDGTQVLLFNVLRPIAPQLERAEAILKKIQTENGLSEPKVKLTGRTRNQWSRHLRVLDGKDQGATHTEIFLQFADEGLVKETNKSQPKAQVSQWHTQALEVMDKAARFL